MYSYLNIFAKSLSWDFHHCGMFIWASPHTTWRLLATGSQQQVDIGRQKPIITRGPSLATPAQGLGGPTWLDTQTQGRRNSSRPFFFFYAAIPGSPVIVTCLIACNFYLIKLNICLINHSAGLVAVSNTTGVANTTPFPNSLGFRQNYCFVSSRHIMINIYGNTHCCRLLTCLSASYGAFPRLWGLRKHPETSVLYRTSPTSSTHPDDQFPHHTDATY